MILKNDPFVNQTLDQDREDDIVNVRLNAGDRKILGKFKELIAQPKDSTALKLALFYAWNVLQRDFTGDIKLKLSKRKVKSNR